MEKMMDRKTLIIYNGGTIGMEGHPYADNSQDAIVQVLRLAGLSENCDLAVTPTIQDSSQLNENSINELLQIFQVAHKDYDGFLILTGTDTMAYLQSILKWQISGLRKPIALTGSMAIYAEDPKEAVTNIQDGLNFINNHLEETQVAIVFGGKILKGGTTKENSYSQSPFEESRNSAIQAWWEERERCEAPFAVHKVKKLGIEVLWCQPMLKCRTSPLEDAMVVMVYGQGTSPSIPSFKERIDAYLSEEKPVLILSQSRYNTMDFSLYAAGSFLEDRSVLAGPGSFFEEGIAYLSHLFKE